MLLQFNVSNFMSIKDEIIISAFANAMKDHEEILINHGNDRILPVMAMYGANAAGKTNIIRAFRNAIMLVRNSNSMQVNAYTGIIPFLFDENKIKEKSKFDFLFVHNGKTFAYGFVADYQYVYEEYLYEYKSSRPTMIFERMEISKYRFTTSYKHLSEFQYKNTSNKLFLCTATAWNCEETRDAFMWFAEGIDTYDQIGIKSNQYLEYLDQMKDNADTKSFLLSLLRHAEINIHDYEFESKNIEKPSIPKIPSLQIDPEFLKDLKHYELSTIHKIEQMDGALKMFKLPFNSESDGTKLLFAYGPIIFEALNKGRTIIIDELGNSLHTNLARYLMELFNDKKINCNGAQLIFNTHDIGLLGLDLFRRDQIYFVEKDNSSGSTDLYSLADFSPRKDENIQKGYLQGRYGAIPFPEGGVEW